MQPPPMPEVDDGHGWIWTAWNDLSAGRPWGGGGMGPMVPLGIPWHHVIDYAAAMGFEPDATETLRSVVARLDGVWLRLETDRIKEDLRMAQGGKGGRG